MKEYSLEGAADRAGVDTGYVERLVALGIVSPDAAGRFSSSDTQKISIMEGLEHAGLPGEGIAEAIRRGTLSLDFVDQPRWAHRFATVGAETFQELSTRTGVPLDLLMAVREAMGFAQPAPGDRIRDDELQVLPLIQLQLDEGVATAVIDRMLRVYGESLRRVADTEADWYGSQILGPLFASGKGIAEVSRLTGRLDGPLTQHGDAAVLALFHGQQANAWMRNIFAGFEDALTHAGLHSRLDRPQAICFLDITGYTRLTEERGDEAAAELAGQLARLVQRTSGQYGGKPVKWLGDGVMFHFREPGPSVLAALEMVAGTAAAGLPPAHVGIHAGSVLFQEGDYFGRTVNVAARIADYARQGEVVVSQEVVDAADGRPDVLFAEIGPVELKGLSGTVRLHVARLAG